MKSLRLVLARAATQRMRRAQPPIATVLTEALGCRYGSRFISWLSSIVSLASSHLTRRWSEMDSNLWYRGAKARYDARN
jgi:hypothetical protein